LLQITLPLMIKYVQLVKTVGLIRKAKRKLMQAAMVQWDFFISWFVF
jgi:hypothetical protein